MLRQLTIKVVMCFALMLHVSSAHATTFDFDNSTQGVEIDDDESAFRHSSEMKSSSSTGPSMGVKASSGYIYFDTSSGVADTAGDKAKMFTQHSLKYISFYYHMYGADIGTLSVEINGQVIWSKSGQQHASSTANWTKVQLDVSEFLNGEDLDIFFLAEAAGGNKGNIAIDEITFSNELDEDVEDVEDEVVFDVAFDKGEPQTYNESHDDSVGTLPGNLSVSATGQAQYNIPLTLPSGVAGLTPSLSLNYSSGGGNGVLGKGWSLGGTQSITRCGQSYTSDGVRLGMKWDSDGRFCLNGSKLILTSSDDYGDVGASYSTEIESHQRVTSLGGSDGSPAYFMLESQDGTITYFGEDEDSQIVVGKGIFKWAISSKVDVNNNEIEYTYNKEGKAFTLDEIKYSEYSVKYNYNSSSETPERLDVQFKGYYVISDLLDLIQVKSNGSVIRSYSIGYQSSSGLNPTSKVTSIQACSATDCFPATSFEWSDDGWEDERYALFGNDQTSDLEGIENVGGIATGDINGDGITDLIVRHNSISETDCTYSYYTGGSNGLTKETTERVEGECDDADEDDHNFSSLAVHDYNLDGRADHRHFVSNPDSSGKWSIYNDSTGEVPGYTSAPSSNDKISAGGIKHLADFNGDGILDKIYLLSPTDSSSCKVETNGSFKTVSSWHSNSVRIKLGSYTGNSSSNRVIWDNDNAIDLELPKTEDAYTIDCYSEADITIESPGYKGEFKFGDFDGDGAIDIMLPKVGFSYGYNSQPGKNYDVLSLPAFVKDGESYTTQGSVEVITSGVFLDWGRTGSVIIADIDNDGSSDIVIKKSEVVVIPDVGDEDDIEDYAYFSYRFGPSLSAERKIANGKYESGATNYTFKKGYFSLVDVNRDGYLDIITNGSPVLLYGKNAKGSWGFEESNITGFGADNDESSVVADFTGDGKVDLIKLDIKTEAQGYVNGVADINFYTSSGALWKTNRIDTITTGSGHETLIRYNPLATTNNYKPFDINASGPVQIKDSICVWFSDEDGCEAIYDGGATSDDFYSRLSEGPINSIADSLTPESLDENLPYKPVIGGMTVVTSVETSLAASSDKKAVDYYYARGFIHGTRGFVGFETVTKVDEIADIETQVVYRQDYPFTGKPYLEEVRVASEPTKILSVQYTDWGINNQASAGTNAPYQVYAKEVNVTSHQLSGGLAKHERTTTELNGDGFVDLTRKEVRDWEGYTIQEVTTNLFYDEVDPDCYDLQGLFNKKTVFYSVIGNVDDETLTTGYGYDSLCRLETETIEPDKPEYTSTTTYGYDGFGNVDNVSLSAEDLTTRTNRYVYDATGRYIAYQYNAKDHLEKQVNSVNAYGQPTSITGLNSTSTTIGYDSFGRQIYQQVNGGNWSATDMKWCTNVTCPEGALIRIKQSDASGQFTYQYTDVLGQVIRTEQNINATDTSFVDFKYNHEGELEYQSEPYAEGAPLWTIFRYDVLGRKTAQVNPDETISTIDYSFDSTRYTNELGQNRSKSINILGQVTSVGDYSGGWVTHSYTALGNLKSSSNRRKSGRSSIPFSIVMEYDDLGRKKSMDDPDKGYWTYQYNAFGELTGQTNANGEYTENHYDELGRLYKRIDKASEDGTTLHTTYWTFDGEVPVGAAESSGSALGLLTGVVHNASSSIECNTADTKVCESISYGSYGRVDSHTKALGAAGNDGSYTNSFEYDSIGRVEKVLDPLSTTAKESGVYYDYSSRGDVSALSNIQGDSKTMVYQRLGLNARGQTTESIRGNGITSTNRYDPLTGRLREQVAENVQGIYYTWDSIGNLKTRINDSGRVGDYDSYENLEERFCYDDLNRLRYTTTDPDEECGYYGKISYDTLGNITYKRDVGEYEYNTGTAGPHAVSRILKWYYDGEEDADYYVNFNYDANGNLISDDEGREITYTVFDKPESIIQHAMEAKNGQPAKSAHQTFFYYGPDRARWKRVDIDKNSNITTTLYLGGGVERVMKYSHLTNELLTNTYERYLGDYALDTVKLNDSHQAVSTTRTYIYKDIQGTVDVITDNVGQVITVMGFDAWGKRRNGYTAWPSFTKDELIEEIAQQLGSSETYFGSTSKGYTGHEMVDEVGLIHMNGRIYDPTIARFLSADPFIPHPDSTQSYNRYSYVQNNPMTRSDPNGYEDANDNENIEVSCGCEGLADDIREGIDDYFSESSGGYNSVDGGFDGSSIHDSIERSAEQANLSVAIDKLSQVMEKHDIGLKAMKDLIMATSKSLKKSLRRHLEGGGDSPGDDNVNAQWGGMTMGSDGVVITQRSIECADRCMIEAGLYTAALSMHFIEQRNQNDYGALATEALYEIGEKFSYGVIGAELIAASAVRWAFLSNSDKLGYFMIFGDGMTLATGGTQAVMADAALTAVYKSATRTLIPRMRLRASPGKPVVRNGNFVAN